MNEFPGLSLDQLFNWNILLNQPFTVVITKKITHFFPWRYQLEKQNQELVLSRFLMNGEAFVAAPWTFHVADVNRNYAEIGKEIQELQCLPAGRNQNMVESLEVKVDNYPIKFYRGQFFMPLTHSYLVDAGRHMAIIDRLMRKQNAYDRELLTERPF